VTKSNLIFGEMARKSRKALSFSPEKRKKIFPSKGTAMRMKKRKN
jgi:hypothetical protein